MIFSAKWKKREREIKYINITVIISYQFKIMKDDGTKFLFLFRKNPSPLRWCHVIRLFPRVEDAATETSSFGSEVVSERFSDVPEFWARPSDAPPPASNVGEQLTRCSEQRLNQRLRPGHLGHTWRFLADSLSQYTKALFARGGGGLVSTFQMLEKAETLSSYKD